jgi:hypothetical protein
MCVYHLSIYLQNCIYIYSCSFTPYIFRKSNDYKVYMHICTYIICLYTYRIVYMYSYVLLLHHTSSGDSLISRHVRTYICLCTYICMFVYMYGYDLCIHLLRCMYIHICIHIDIWIFIYLHHTTLGDSLISSFVPI